jgi:hypothetical protein
MNCKAMSQIVKPRLIASSVVPTDTRNITEATESSFCKRSNHRLAMARYEERFACTAGDAPLISLLCVGRESTGEPNSNWYQPCAIELAFADRQEIFGQVHVLAREA